MKYVLKALHWAYGDSVKYIAMMAAFAAFVGFLMTLIAYPVQTLTFLILGGAAVVLFTLFSEWR